MSSNGDHRHEDEDGTITTTKTVKVAVTEHPRHKRYPNSGTREFMCAQMMYVAGGGDISDSPSNRETVDRFAGTLRVGDVIGIGNYTYVIEDRGGCGCSPPPYANDVALVARSTKTKQLASVPYSEAATALAIGYAEILYRGGKPYGVELEKEVTVKIVERRQAQPEADSGQKNQQEDAPATAANPR